MSAKKILVTGGAGYIGGFTAEALLKAGNTVVILDDLSAGHKQAVPEGAKFYDGKIGDAALLDRVFQSEKPDAVMHFAAFIEAGESMSRPAEYFANNTNGALELLRAAVRADVKQFVFSSTAAVYGEPRQVPITEDHPKDPVNAYGASKLLVEQMLPWFLRAYGLRYAILRYFNASGGSATRGEAHKHESHLIPLVLQAALGKRDAITVFGSDYNTPDGTCIRDYIHVNDLAAAHLLALQTLDKERQLTMNVGTGHGYSIREVLETAKRITGRNINVKEGERRPGDPAVLVASNDRIRGLGWTPKFSDLETIVSSAWEWHSSHPNGYDE